MTDRLTPHQVGRHLEALAAHLTGMQDARLRAILPLVDQDGRFRLRDALEAGEFPAGDGPGQEAFQDFRRKVNQTAADAGVRLRVEVDSRKVSPDRRWGWFTGDDLVDEEIASFASATAGRQRDHPVEPEVTEIGASRRTRVYVSHHVPVGGSADRRTTDLLARLRQSLALDHERSWEVTDTDSIGIGEERESVRTRHLGEADVTVALLSTAYLADGGAERDRVLGTPGVVPFAVGSLPDGPIRLGPLATHEVRSRQRPWDARTTQPHRAEYVQSLVDEIRRAASRAASPAPAKDPRLDELPEQADRGYEDWSGRLARAQRTGESNHLVDPEVAETALRESLLDQRNSAPGRPLPAVSRLLDWATASGGPRLCALLGDTGLGKTTTTKLLTQRLLSLRAHDPKLPLPMLFDLRDVEVSALPGNITLNWILDSMLRAQQGPDEEPLTSDAVRRRISHGNAVVIFDGLDEVLVHLSPHDRQLFMRQLWRAADEESGSRLLLTCRTQYFRTLREQMTFFVGEGRERVRGESYLALLMLPFGPEQIRQYLERNVNSDPVWVEAFLDTMAGVHNLTELASRPLTLGMIAGQVSFIEDAKLHGRSVRAADLYYEMVDRWLGRESGKNTLEPEHKWLLMEEIAAALWRSGRNSWGPKDVDDWLLAILDERPDLQRHYRERVPDLWKADFRTATFLSRTDDMFAFAHRSLSEYFLARYLCRTLTTDSAGDQDLAAWAMSVPSPETLDFLGQMVDGLEPDVQTVALRRLGDITRKYVAEISELALAYALRAAGAGYPHQSLHGVQLPGAQLEGWRFEISRPSRAREADHGEAPGLDLAGANLRGSRLRGAVFTATDLGGADLSGADLTVSEFHKCQLLRTQFATARMAGTVLRRCAIEGADLEAADAYRAEVLHCAPSPRWAPEAWLVAPLSEAGASLPAPGALQILTGHTGGVTSVAFDPTGTRLASAGADGTVRLWDATTGQPTGLRLAHLPLGELAVFDAVSGRLVGASDGAWRWLGWNVVLDGRITRLPAETFGSLPPLPGDARMGA